MTHTRGKPYHPMTQGKIERYHRSLKNQILLENYYLFGQLEARLAEFVDYYNLRRYPESFSNLTLDVGPPTHGARHWRTRERGVDFESADYLVRSGREPGSIHACDARYSLTLVFLVPAPTTAAAMAL